MSEVQLSKLENFMTIGAEYYSPAYSKPVEVMLNSGIPTDSLGKVCSLITDGDHGSAAYAEDGVRFILSEAVTDGWIDESKCRFVTEAHAQKLSRSALRREDVLVTKTGVYFGKSAVVENDFVGANTIAHVGILRLKDRKFVDPYVVSAFLNSKFGQAQLRRRGIKATRPEIKLLEFSDILVPIFSPAFQEKIRKTLLAARSTRESCQKHLEKAQQSLLTALGLDNWQQPSPVGFVQNNTAAFVAGRLDAEHFHPRYESLLEHLRSTGEHARLGDLLLLNQRGKQPDYADDGFPVVNSKHVAGGEVRIDEDNRFAVYSGELTYITKGDVLMNGTGVGTIGRTAPYLHDFAAIPDNHVTVLRPKSCLDPVFLSVFLNSKAGQLQVNQRLRGSSGQIELYPTDIAEFTVWNASEAVQASVRTAVEKSFDQKQQAARLLSSAREAIEVALEDSEAAASAYLEEKLHPKVNEPNAKQDLAAA